MPKDSYEIPKDLENAAYKDFGIGEGCVEGMYIDIYGHPTIGTGKLIVQKDEIWDDKKLAKYKAQYLELPISTTDKNGKKIDLNRKQKEAQFDALIGAMRVAERGSPQIYNGKKYTKPMKHNGGRPDYITYPPMGKLSKSDNPKVFHKSINYWYNETKKVFGDRFDTFPQSLQLSILHAAYGGRLSAVAAHKNESDVELANTCLDLFNGKLKSDGNPYPGNKKGNKSSIGTIRTAEVAVADTIAAQQQRIIPEPIFEEQIDANQNVTNNEGTAGFLQTEVNQNVDTNSPSAESSDATRTQELGFLDIKEIRKPYENCQNQTSENSDDFTRAFIGNQVENKTNSNNNTSVYDLPQVDIWGDRYLAENTENNLTTDFLDTYQKNTETKDLLLDAYRKSPEKDTKNEENQPQPAPQRNIIYAATKDIGRS